MQEQSNKQFYISDWHYGHANVIAFDNRPFKSLLEMDEALVDRWNAVVSPGDTVYVLGDMFWCKAQDAIPILRSLKGQKFLIKGNHDRCNDNKFLRDTKPCQMFNVGVMMPWMDYTPRTLDEIIAANSHNEAVRNK